MLACKSRDSAPIRVADPETVWQLSESYESGPPGQRRTQVGGNGGPPVRTSRAPVPGRTRADVVMSPDVGGGGQGRELLSPGGPAGSPRLGSLAGSPGRGGAGVRGGPPGNGDVRRRQPSSSLLDCAREPVRQVHLMAPLSAPQAPRVETGPPAAGSQRLPGACGRGDASHTSVGAEMSPGGGSSLGCGAAVSPRASMVGDDGPAGARPRLSGEGGLESSLQVTSEGASPGVTTLGERGERESRGGEADLVQPSGGDEGNFYSTQSTSGGVSAGVRRHGGRGGEVGSGVGEGSGTAGKVTTQGQQDSRVVTQPMCTGAKVSGALADMSGPSRSSRGRSAGSRDIRDFF